jgi:hypothetical protein
MAKKQAVLLIHGIGEQKPMETLRGFVDAVWRRDQSIHHQFAGSGVWSKPDMVSRSYELRRLTTPQNVAGIRTDFFEFYWAHLMQGTTLGHLVAWAKSLLLRKPSTVPRHLRLVYWVLVILVALVIVFAVYAAIQAANDAPSFLPAWASALVSLALLPLLGWIMRSIVGDAARYLHVAPTNVQRRHEIRQAGVELIEELHKRKYDRIIVVGHSLGSVIGYDILTYAWSKSHMHTPASSDAPMTALDALELKAASRSREVQSAQRDYYDEMFANGHPWRVTDFVTLGSPLAHGAVLLARDANDLERRQSDREFPTCLPTLETRTRGGKVEQRFSFEPDPASDFRVPHHAAVFGPTRWTNLFFPSRFIVRGDLIGGPLKPVFGPGIRDVELSTRQRLGFFSHTLYWRYSEGSEAPPHIVKLREALDLIDSPGA